MPIKIKHKIKDEIVDALWHDRQSYPPGLWDIVEKRNLYYVYEPIQTNSRIDKREVGTFEEDRAIDYLSKNPTYVFEKIPDVIYEASNFGDIPIADMSTTMSFDELITNHKSRHRNRF